MSDGVLRAIAERAIPREFLGVFEEKLKKGDRAGAMRMSRNWIGKNILIPESERNGLLRALDDSVPAAA